MQVGNHFLSETILIFGAVDVGVDLCVVAFLLEDGEVLQHFRLVLGSPTQQMLEVQFNETIGIAVFKKLLLVKPTFRHLTHEFTNAEKATFEQGLRTFQALGGHDVLIAEHLLVDRSDQSFVVIFRGVGPVFLVAVVGKTLDAQVGGVGECHERGGRR